MDEAQINKRIEQWRHMTEADPDNAMGWFSLGGAYKDGGYNEEAARSLRRAIELDPGLSRAYQLLGQLLIASDDTESAEDVLTRGYTVAAERGDVMPQKAMGSLLQKIDKPVPEVASKAPQVEVDASGDTIVDRRTGQVGSRLPAPPMKGPLGQFIYDHYSAQTFREWIAMGTKVINELRLDFSNVEHQKVYDVHMMDWLGFTQEEVDAYASQQ